MDTNARQRPLNRGMVVSVVLTGVLVSGVVALATVTATVKGTASLPNGTTAVINGPFSCSCNTPTTEIDAGGHRFAFSPTEISIDGVIVGPLDASVTEVEIDASYWAATLRVNGTEVGLKR